ncbi:MAG: 8-amino-7-oxononanoate synthase [Aquificae bacterium]|nr:8-amino-7-oxononanoate synthase [Aquificota bacterium]
MFTHRLKEELKSLKEQNMYRNLSILRENIIDFSSNDYLGLKDCKKTKKQLCQKIDTLQLGSGASLLVSGYTKIQNQLEKHLSNLKETQKCIVVGSGYLANIGMLQALIKKEDTVLSDELNHASIIDGLKLTKAEKLIYKHKNTKDLETKLKTRKNKGQIFIVTDGVFSMEGDIAPLDDIYKISKKYDAVLIIDDAHATGILGEGKGTLFHFGLKPEENIIQMGTLSKAVGSYGAFICASEVVIEYLINKMRTAIFTTALSPIQNYISLQNLQIMQAEPHRRLEVLQKAKYLAEGLKKARFKVTFNGTPIIPLIVNEEKKAIKIRDFLLQNNIFLQAIRPPTVPKGTSRLRITISYKHSYEDIEKLLSLLTKFQT